MPRTIAALYDSRAEAEFARAGLVSQAHARSVRIISKDTAGAVDGLDIASSDKVFYRDGLRDGGHLLVAEAPRGTNAELIIDLLEQASGHEEGPPDELGDSGPVFRVEPTGGASVDKREGSTEVQPRAEEREELAAPSASVCEIPAEAKTKERYRSLMEEASRKPWFEDKLRHGRGDVQSAGARVRSFTRDAVAEEPVTLRDERISVERRPCDRDLADSENESGSLFKERVFEFAEMREEPVVTKIAVVHEEVIVRKVVKERTETIRDTVRQTQVEVEDLPAPGGPPPAFFGQEPT